MRQGYTVFLRLPHDQWQPLVTKFKTDQRVTSRTIRCQMRGVVGGGGRGTGAVERDEGYRGRG
jgi:hypothetical protein